MGGQEPTPGGPRALPILPVSHRCHETSLKQSEIHPTFIPHEGAENSTAEVICLETADLLALGPMFLQSGKGVGAHQDEAGNKETVPHLPCGNQLHHQFQREEHEW